MLTDLFKEGIAGRTLIQPQHGRLEHSLLLGHVEVVVREDLRQFVHRERQQFLLYKTNICLSLCPQTETAVPPVQDKCGSVSLSTDRGRRSSIVWISVYVALTHSVLISKFQKCPMSKFCFLKNLRHILTIFQKQQIYKLISRHRVARYELCRSAIFGKS